MPQARHQILLARDWFVMWMGLLSFLIAQTIDGTHENQIPKWVEALADEGFPQVWLSSIMASSINHFSSSHRRSGIFVDLLGMPIGCTSQPPVSFFLSRNVSVWYPWTAREMAEARYNSTFAGLAPPPELMQAATTWIVRSPQASVPPYQGRTTAQKLMTWKEFFSARDRRQAEKESKETPEHRQRRLQRQRDRPVKKAKVFTWDYNDGDPPQRVRTCVSQKYNEDTIAGYGRRQKIYNAWDNEWDLCEEFGDDDSDNDGDSDDGYERAFNHNSSSTVGQSDPVDYTISVVPSEPDDEAIVRLDEAEEHHIHGYLAGTAFDRSASPLLRCGDDGNIDALYSEPTRLLSIHYGFVPCLQDIPSSPQDDVRWKCALHTLGINSVLIVDLPLSSIEKAMCRFVTTLSTGNRPREEEWDLRDGNRQALVHSPRFSISRPAPNLFVFSSPPSPSCDWVLGLTNAADALYALRLINQREVNIYGVARCLMEEGVPFRTLTSLPYAQLPSMRSTRAIPVRLPGYQFTPHDYAAYLRERAAILSLPNGRAALLQGGIVWRLALQSLSPDAALQGPSSAVTAGRVGYSTDELEAGLALWDDELTPVENNLICGVYECRTGSFIIPYSPPNLL
jgi:hypothetical protein